MPLALNLAGSLWLMHQDMVPVENWNGGGFLTTTFNPGSSEHFSLLS